MVSGFCHHPSLWCTLLLVSAIHSVCSQVVMWKEKIYPEHVMLCTVFSYKALAKCPSQRPAAFGSGIVHVKKHLKNILFKVRSWWAKLRLREELAWIYGQFDPLRPFNVSLSYMFIQVWHWRFLRSPLWFLAQDTFSLHGGRLWGAFQHGGRSHQTRQVRSTLVLENYNQT